MKKIILLGDSIRMGYDKYVKEALAGTAEVYYPEENCRFAVYLLRYAHEWKQRGDWPEDADLVHWNAGLWDVLELFGDAPMTEIDYYGRVIARIDKRLRMLFPKAKMVFALSTPVLEAQCGRDFGRHNETIRAYNEAAVQALSATDTVINDLYALTANCPEEYHSDMTHYYTDAGTALIGGKVLSVICDALSVDAKDVNIENFCPEQYSAANIGG